MTWLGAAAIQHARESLGGHGYSALNRLGEMRDTHGARWCGRVAWWLTWLG
jgi:hypothetical protein